MKHREIPAFDLDKVLALRAEGLSIKSIEKRVGAPYNTLQYWLSTRHHRLTRRELSWRRWESRWGQDNFRKLLLEGKSYRIVANKLGICPKSLAEYIQHHKLPVQISRLPQGPAAKESYDPTINQSLKEMFEKGFSRGRMAKAIGLSNEQIYGRLRTLGLVMTRSQRFQACFPDAETFWQLGRRFQAFVHFCHHYGFSVEYVKSEAGRREYKVPRLRARRTDDFDLDLAIRMYRKDYSMQLIADHLNVDKSKLSKAIKQMGVIPYKYKASKKRAVYKHTIEMRRRHMLNRYGFPLKADSMPDFFRLRFLLRQIASLKPRFQFCNTFPQKFLDKFYFDDVFNAIYDHWQKNDCAKMSVPSIDHIIPLSRGGTWRVQNLQFMTWWENRSKGDLTMSEWREFLRLSGSSSSWYVDTIMSRLQAPSRL